jgi:hypothetical protein
LLTRIQEQQAVIDELSISPIGILSPAAIRRALRLMPGPIDLICLDFRKLHEWNDILGYDLSSAYFGRFCRTRQVVAHRSPERRNPPPSPLQGGYRGVDVRGQYGGDEIVIAVAPGDGPGLVTRLVEALDELTAELPLRARVAMHERTGGLIDGFAAAIVLIPGSHHPLIDAARGITETGRLKAGRQTGERASSGAAGTIVATLAPLSDPHAVTRQSIQIEAAMRRCVNCDGPHFTWRCPEIGDRLFAPEQVAI